MNIDLFSINFNINKWSFSIDFSIWLVLIITLIIITLFILRILRLKSFSITKLDISLGNIGKIELKPSIEDKQIAHRIWTQLITRKAAIRINPQQDVIVEIYNSWYALFSHVRELISNIPADQLNKKSTQSIIRIATLTLNDGLRPHLTEWQAKFRNWYDCNSDELKKMSPQELQSQYPYYTNLINDMSNINQQMISYANELKKLATN